MLRTALLTRHAGAEQIAALFSMHPRTLARQLEARGTRFQVLVDEVRFEIARQMLEQSTMDVREVAATLDYADASALTRAFRRWSGSTPTQWRAQRAAAGGLGLDGRHALPVPVWPELQCPHDRVHR